MPDTGVDAEPGIQNKTGESPVELQRNLLQNTADASNRQQFELLNVAPTTGGTSARDLEADPPSTSLKNLFLAWSIGFLSAIEATISVPSMWSYIQSLGGDEKYYGLCVSSFGFGRLICMGIFGAWVDRRSYREVLVVSMLGSMIASLMYASAPTLGLWAILAGRLLLGAMSAQSVATQAYVSRHTSMADRTRYMSINVLCTSTLTIAGPAFNLLIVALPHFDIAMGSHSWVFNSYTWVGYFLFWGQSLILIFIFTLFREPPSSPYRPPRDLGRVARCLTLGGLFPWMRLFVDPWLHKTGAWYIFMSNFRNNFTVFGIAYAVPLITKRDYGWEQVQLSWLFSVLSIESIVSTAILARLSKKVSDRKLLLAWDSIAHSGLLAYALASGFGSHKIPPWLLVFVVVWYDFGTCMPATQSLYSKLIGKGNLGLYFSVLQSNGAISRVVSGQVVGFAYGHFGAPCLWLVTQGMWCLNWLGFALMWKKLSPEYIQSMHMRLESELIGTCVETRLPSACD